ncbi:MAG: YggS family pyridoxal phosphate-dependent enzyme [Candidatus Krumholzibacteriia bacterium]
MEPSARDIEARLAVVRERIERARDRAGRRDPVTLVAVSKTAPLTAVVAACLAGHRDFGENRMQDAVPRVAALPALLAAAGLPPATAPRWHFIGHLQSNKAHRAIGPFALLHAVDDLALAGRLDRAAAAAPGRQAVLLEVNVAREPQKAGVAPEAAVDSAARLAGSCPHLELRGLMAMARFGAAEAELRATFGALRELAAAARSATRLPLPDLSMGMSDDYEIAVEEGATLVRVGTALFGPRAG